MADCRKFESWGEKILFFCLFPPPLYNNTAIHFHLNKLKSRFMTSTISLTSVIN